MNFRMLCLPIVLSITIFLSCDTPKKTNQKKFSNTFMMDKSFAKSCGLPEIDFSISYPNNKDLRVVKPKKDSLNSNYISFFINKNEELTIGWLKGDSQLFKMFGQGETLLNQFKKSFLAFDPNAETVFLGYKEFVGREAYQLQMRYEITSKEKGDVGQWMVNIVLCPREAKPGVMLVLQVKEPNSNIKGFDDFGKKGLLGDIWSTFEFH